MDYDDEPGGFGDDEPIPGENGEAEHPDGDADIRGENPVVQEFPWNNNEEGDAGSLWEESEPESSSDADESVGDRDIEDDRVPIDHVGEAPPAPQGPEGGQEAQNLEPDHIRFLRHFLVHSHTQYRATQDEIRFALKSFNWAFSEGILAPGPASTPDGPDGPALLPSSLKTLLSDADIHSHLRAYAVCPNLRCQHICLSSELPTIRQSPCVKCKTPLMRKKTWKGKKNSDYYVPALIYPYAPLIPQIERLLSRQDIKDAIRNHKSHLTREGRNPGVYEDIQDGQIWKDLKRADGTPFFTADGEELGFMLTVDW